jgi:two-component system response regulator YesN
MYRVVLADDEPIFLLGMKHLINWEDSDCQVIGTASNREEALALAAAERKKWRELNHPPVQAPIAVSLREPVCAALLRLLENAGPALPQDITLPEREGIMQRFAVLYIPLDYSALPGIDRISEEEIRRLYYWERDVTEKTGVSFFPNVIVPAREDHCRRLFLFAWNLTRDLWEMKLGEFRETLMSASARSTRLGVEVMASEYCEDSSSFETLLEDIAALKTWYYLTGKGVLRCRDIERIAPEPLALEGAGVKLEDILKRRDGEGCRVFFDRIIKQIRETPHRQDEALWLCGGLYTAIRNVLGSEERARCMPDAEYRRISCYSRREELAAWVEKTGDALSGLLDRKPSGHADIIEKIRRYILDNLERHISLRDVADHVCISPGYLSTVFKKEYSRNLIDYINMIKMERACELIRQKRYRIYEISHKVGFDNAFYFTRVFRRHTGLSPSEYRKREEERKDPPNL